MWSFVRASPLSPQVKIYLKQDYPISLKYEMGSHGKHSLGEAIFVMAPKLEDEEPFPVEDPEESEKAAPEPAESRAEPEEARAKPTKRRKTAAAAATPPPASPPPFDPPATLDIGAWHEDDPGQEEGDCLEWE